MKDHHDLPTSQRRGRFDRLRDRIEEWLFAAGEDARAQARGLEVAKGPRGVRVYRDPRWDSVQACRGCGGAGTADGETCPACTGTGVIRPATAVPVADGGIGAQS